MDRLLNDTEKHTLYQDYHIGHADPSRLIDDTAKAQLAKADKEWVEWLDSKCPHDSLGINNFTRRECFECWQSRKQEIGI